MSHVRVCAALTAVGVCLLVAGPVLAQAAGEPGIAEAPVDAAFGPPSAERRLARSQWLVLMALLGEQLPAEAVLREVTLDSAPADVRVRVMLPRDGATALEAELTRSLQFHFDTVELQPGPTSDEAPYVARDIALTGIPTLQQYRARRREAAGAQAPAPVPDSAAAAAPAGNAATEVQRESPEGDWPPMELQRVFAQAGGTLIAQLLLGGRQYIVREGNTFANRQYRFIAVTPGTGAVEGADCVTLEQEATGATRTICPEP